MLDRFEADRPLVGMVHLPPLPGAPRYDGDRAAVRERALADARALADGGIDGLIVENFGDAPFYPEDVPNHVVADLTALVGAVRAAVPVPVGANVLRNDANAAVSVAAATGAAFVRVNVHAGARVTDQGVIEGRAHETLRLRERLDCDVGILADVAVKHSAPLGTTDLAGATRDLLERGLAGGVVVSGPGTGRAVDRERLVTVAEVADELGAPTFVGSGVTPANAPHLLDVADGAIVGSALREGGDPTNPVARDRVEELVDAVR